MKWEKVSSLISTSGLADTGSSVGMGINWGETGGEEKKAKTDQSTTEENLKNWQSEENSTVLSSLLDGQHYNPISARLFQSRLCKFCSK